MSDFYLQLSLLFQTFPHPALRGHLVQLLGGTQHFAGAVRVSTRSTLLGHQLPKSLSRSTITSCAMAGGGGGVVHSRQLSPLMSAPHPRSTPPGEQGWLCHDGSPRGSPAQCHPRGMGGTQLVLELEVTDLGAVGPARVSVCTVLPSENKYR